MSDKTSQKTEDDMLEQTFGGYDEEMTVQTETHTSDPKTKTKVEKKKSSNTPIFIGGGIAAVAIVGYMFYSGHNKPQPVVQHHAAPVAPVAPPVAVAPASADVASNPNALQNSQPNQNAAAQFLSAQNNTPNGAATVVTPSSDMNQPAPMNPAMGNNAVVSAPVMTPPAVVNMPQSGIQSSNAPVVQQMTPAVPAMVQPGSAPVGNDVQLALVSQLKQMFDQQTQELKGSLNDVGNRVSSLEKTVSDQQDINKQINDRLAKLEAGKPTKAVVADKSTDKADDKVSEAKPHAVRKVYHRHVVRKVRAVSDDSSDVLVDKSNVSHAAPVATKPDLPSVNVYSVYGGRIWTKNGDDSLSTYVAGDRLPSGEIIKRVDDTKVITNERVITVK